MKSENNCPFKVTVGWKGRFTEYIGAIGHRYGSLTLCVQLSGEINMEITARDFRLATNSEPEMDDLDRVNCKSAGKIGHINCGWCFEHNKPKFMCFTLEHKK
jgi:hypothetical protein